MQLFLSILEYLYVTDWAMLILLFIQRCQIRLDTASLNTVKISLVDLTAAVLIDEFSSWNRAEIIKWQRFINIAFVFASDDTDVYRYMTEAEEKRT